MKRFAVLLLVCSATGCGDETRTPPPREAPAQEAVPEAPPFDWSVGPQRALEALRAMDDEDARDALLEAWPRSDDYAKAQETQQALTWRLRRRLAQERYDAAFEDLENLRIQFEGGMSPQGRRVSVDAMREAFTDTVLEHARQHAEGDTPTPARAERALDVAERVAGDDMQDRVRGTRRWIAAPTLDERVPLAPHEGPRVVLAMDHFALGDAQLRATLLRWATRKGLRVSLVPILTGEVRQGLRRVPVARDTEVEALREAAKTLGLYFEGPQDRDPGALLGLPPKHSGVLALNAAGQIVGRLSARTPALQRLENTVQRLTTR